MDMASSCTRNKIGLHRRQPGIHVVHKGVRYQGISISGHVIVFYLGLNADRGMRSLGG